ncbi:MAG: glycosyltransferase family 39 protein [Solirubrobacteraceae bacterium]
MSATSIAPENSPAPRAAGVPLVAAWRPGRALLVILAVALLLRLGLIASTPGFQPTYDGADYQRVATALVSTGGYPPTTYATPGTPSAFRPPAWPYALAGAYALAGPHAAAGRVLGALLGTLSVLLLALAASELFGRRIGLLAAGATAVFPPLWFADTALLSESLFTACALGLAWALLRARRAERPRRWIAGAGVLCGLAVLTRSQGFVLLVPLVMAAWELTPGGRGRSAGSAALAVTVALAVLLPWTVRNFDAFGTLVPVSTQSGYTLAGTYNSTAAAKGSYYGAARLPARLPQLRGVLTEPGQDEAQLDRRLGTVARSFAAQHPRYDLDVARRNSLRLLTLGGLDQRWLTRLSNREMGIPRRLDQLLSLAVALEFALALAGAVVLVRRLPGTPGWRGPAWWWAIPVLLWGSTVIVSGAPRYRVVVDPFVLVLVGVAISWWFVRRTGRPRLEVA